MAVVTNRIPNPKAGVSTAGLYTYGGQNNFTFTRSASGGPGGISAFEFAFNSGQTGDAGARFNSISLPAGTYTLQYQCTTGPGVTNAHLVVRDTAFNVLAQKHYGANKAWGRDSVTFTLGSSASVDVFFGIGSYGATSGGTCWFTQFCLTSGSTLIPYFDGDTPDVPATDSVPGHTYSWLGTANLSQSTWDNNVTAGGGGGTTTTPPPTSPANGVDNGRRTAIYNAIDQWFAKYMDSQGRVHGNANDPTEVVSEAQAYAMVFAVLRGSKEKFDLARSWSNGNLMRSNNGSLTTGLSLWAWRYYDATGVDDWNWASDADYDRWLALARAAELWGDESYFTELDALHDDLETYTLNTDEGRKYQTTDAYQQAVSGNGNHAISGGVTWEMNGSYLNFIAYRILKKYSGDTDWDAAATGGYDYITKATDNAGGLPTTAGLVPAWSDYSTTSHDVGPIEDGTNGWTSDRTTDYQYDAFRAPIRMAQAAILFPDDPRPKNYLGGAFKSWSITEWGTSNKITDGYSHAGVETSPYQMNFFAYASYFALKVSNPADSTAADIKNTWLSNLQATDSSGTYFRDQPSPHAPSTSYYGSSWMIWCEALDSGLLAELVDVDSIEGQYGQGAPTPTPGGGGTDPGSPSGPAPTAPTGYTLVDFDDFTGGNTLSQTRWRVYSSGGGSSAPIDGWHLWADPDNQIGTVRGQFTDPVVLKGIDYIVNTPAAKWLGIGWVPLGGDVTRNAVQAAQRAGKRPVFIFYSIVSRDFGQSSSGGAANAAEYKQWCDEQFNAIGDAYAVINLEPDALPQVLGMRRENRISQAEFDARMELLTWTVQRARAKCPNVKIYHDNGHSQWLGPEDMASVLALAGVEYCDGVNENVSNFRPTADCERHALGTVELLENDSRYAHLAIPKGRLGWIIDTSRNGAQNPPNPSDWQNPTGVALGAPSRYNPNGLDGNPRRHGWIWCKVPGESDGRFSDPGDWIPPPPELSPEVAAGEVYVKMLEHIIRNSVITTPTVGGQAAVQSNGALQIMGSGEFVGGVAATSNAQKYGRWEVAAKVDRGPGYGPVIQLKSNAFADGAIGILTHRDGGADEVIFWVRDGNNNVSETTVPLDLTVMHTYAVEWTATAITFFIDGGQAWRLTEASKFPVGALNTDMGLLVGTGSPIAARTASTPQPFRLTVDSYAVFRPSTTPGGPGTPGGGTGALVKDWYYNAAGQRVGAPPSMGITQARQYARAIYDSTWAFTATTESCLPGEVRICRPDQVTYNASTTHGTVSEGMGYMMEACATWGNPALPAGLYDPQGRTRFDSMWRYVKRMLNGRGLMDWVQDRFGRKTDTGGATDGDFDIARALWLAHDIWGSNGEINYAAEARKMTNAIKAYEFTPANSDRPNEMLNGDQWGERSEDRMPDYARPASWRRFMEGDGDLRWEAFIAKHYATHMEYFDRTYSTGFVPDWTNRQFQRQGNQSYLWSYNAIRHPRGSLLEYLQYPDQANPLARKMANKVAAFGKQFSGGNPANLKAEWELNGVPTQPYFNLAFASAFGVAAIADQTNSEFASALLQFMYDRRETDKTYFGTTLATIASITMAGLSQRYAEDAPPTTTPTTLAGRDSGTSNDTGSLQLERKLVGTDTGTSNDSGQLRVTVSLAGTDSGSSLDLGSISVDGSAPAVLLSGIDRGDSADSAAPFLTATIRLSGYDSGTSNDTAELALETPGLARPAVGPVAEKVYASLGNLTEGDEDTGWHLLHFIAALTDGIQDTADLVGGINTPNWSALVDADLTPASALPWLGQFVGVDPMRSAITEEGQRIRLKEASGFTRGTPAAIRGAARQSLTGRKRVQLFERDGSPYRMRVVVFASETPNPDLTYKLVMAAKPAGINIQFVIASGMSYNDLKATGLTYDQLKTRWPTYDDMRAALPTGDEG